MISASSFECTNSQERSLTEETSSDLISLCPTLTFDIEEPLTPRRHLTQNLGATMVTAFGIMQEGKTISLSPTGIIAIDDLRLSICQKFYDASTILIQVEGCHHIFCEGSLHSVI